MAEGLPWGSPKDIPVLNATLDAAVAMSEARMRAKLEEIRGEASFIALVNERLAAGPEGPSPAIPADLAAYFGLVDAAATNREVDALRRNLAEATAQVSELRGLLSLLLGEAARILPRPAGTTVPGADAVPANGEESPDRAGDGPGDVDASPGPAARRPRRIRSDKGLPRTGQARPAVEAGPDTRTEEPGGLAERAPVPEADPLPPPDAQPRLRLVEGGGLPPADPVPSESAPAARAPAAADGSPPEVPYALPPGIQRMNPKERPLAAAVLRVLSGDPDRVFAFKEILDDSMVVSELSRLSNVPGFRSQNLGAVLGLPELGWVRDGEGFRMEAGR